VAVEGLWVYVTTGPLGLSVFSQECPAGTGIGSGENNGAGAKLGLAYPNPTQYGATTIPFTMPARGSAKLRILDLAGREVRVLVDEVLEAGEQSTGWDGRDCKGQRVPGGIYFYEFRGPDFQTTRKLVRIR